jgi:hypothetical protein
MDARKCLATVAFAGLLVIGGLEAAAAHGTHQPAEDACFGQHVSMMAREHGGMANATAHHNAMHDPDYTVGEHQAHMREMGCEMHME